MDSMIHMKIPNIPRHLANGIRHEAIRTDSASSSLQTWLKGCNVANDLVYSAAVKRTAV